MIKLYLANICKFRHCSSFCKLTASVRCQDWNPRPCALQFMPPNPPSDASRCIGVPAMAHSGTTSNNLFFFSFSCKAAQV